MFFISPNAKTLSVLITPSGGNSVASTTFPTQQDLENRKIVAVEAFSANDMTYDPLNSGTPILTTPVFNAAFLTLYVSAVKNPNNFSRFQQPGLFYDKIPFSSLRRVQNYTTGTAQNSNLTSGIFMIRPTEMSFNKCKVELPTTVAMANEMSAVFVFHYLDIGDDGTDWMRAMGYDFTKKY